MASPKHRGAFWRRASSIAARILLVTLLGCGLWATPVSAQTSGEETEQVDEGGKKKKDKKKKEKKEKAPKEKKKKKDKKKDGGESDTAGGDDAAKIGSDGLDSDLETIRDTTVSQIDTTETHAAWLCARYRTGKMEFIDKNFQGIKVKRKRKSEIWYNLNTGNKSKFKIIWEGNCYYKLRFKKSKKPNRFRKGNEMGFKIVACYEDYCDIDADLHAIMYYVSLRKAITNKEKKLKAKQELQKLKEEEKAARIAEQEARFGKGEEEGEKKAGEEAKKEAPETGAKESGGEGEKSEKKEKKEKAPKEKKEKKEKAPKEKKEKKKKEPKKKKKDEEEEEEE